MRGRRYGPPSLFEERGKRRLRSLLGEKRRGDGSWVRFIWGTGSHGSSFQHLGCSQLQVLVPPAALRPRARDGHRGQEGDAGALPPAATPEREYRGGRRNGGSQAAWGLELLSHPFLGRTPVRAAAYLRACICAGKTANKRLKVWCNAPDWRCNMCDGPLAAWEHCP